MYAPFDLSGKAALITGGNGGIGLGMAEALAQAGADLVIWGTNEQKNAEAKAALSAYGRRVFTRRVDVAHEAEIVDGMRASIAEMGRLDSVFANAGIGKAETSFLEITAESFRRIESVNEEGVFFTLREAAKHMVARAKTGDPGGSLIICGSGSIFQGVPTMAHYGTAKGGLNSMAKALAAELGPHGIRANVIAPGFIITEMTQADPVLGAQIAAAVARRAPGRPESFR